MAANNNEITHQARLLNGTWRREDVRDRMGGKEWDVRVRRTKNERGGRFYTFIVTEWQYTWYRKRHHSRIFGWLMWGPCPLLKKFWQVRRGLQGSRAVQNKVNSHHTMARWNARVRTVVRQRRRWTAYFSSKYGPSSASVAHSRSIFLSVFLV